VGVTVRFRKGAWWVFVNHQGRRKAKRIGDRETAQKVAQGLREALARGELNLPALAEGQTFRAYAEKWLEQARVRLKGSTVMFYESHLEQHIYPSIGTRRVEELRRADCRDLIFRWREKGLKVSTVRGVVRTVSTILSQAVDDELLSANPALHMGKYLRRGDEGESLPDPFTRDEAALVVTTAYAHFQDWYPWVLTALRTGMRLSELLGLQWGDIDWRSGTLTVARSLVRGRVTTPKNHHRRRIDLSRQLQVALRLWRRQERRLWLAKGQPRPEWVFASVSGTALDESNVRKALNRILEKAELRHRGPHQMRHTCASLLLAAGEPITYVSKLLGHHDASITLRVYAHWLPDTTRRRGVDQLDDARPSATPAQPEALTVNERNQLSRYERVVSREAIEPSTRRLRVCCSAN